MNKGVDACHLTSGLTLAALGSPLSCDARDGHPNHACVLVGLNIPLDSKHHEAMRCAIVVGILN